MAATSHVTNGGAPDVSVRIPCAEWLSVASGSVLAKISGLRLKRTHADLVDIDPQKEIPGIFLYSADPFAAKEVHLISWDFVRESLHLAQMKGAVLNISYMF